MGHQTYIKDSDILDSLSVRYLKISGLWKIINDFRTTGKKNWILKFQVLTTLLLTVPSIICQYVALVAIEIDIQKATILNFHSLPPLQALCKHLVFWFNIKRLCKLYNLMRKDFLEKTLPDIEPETVKLIFRRISKLCNKICFIVFFVISFGLSIVVFFTSISVDYILYHTGSMSAVKTGKKKISTGWYPLPMDTSPCYEIVLFYEGIFVTWCGAFLLLFMSHYYQLLMCLYAQFELLKSHISALKINYEYEKNFTEKSKQINLKLYRILQDHQKLLRFSDELRSIYNPLLTMILGMGISILTIAIFQFLFGRSGDPLFVLRSLIYLFYQSTEVCIFCFGSSLIEAASSDLQFAVYSSDWYKADVKFRKAAQMMMIRARKGVTLTAIRMYPVNLETLMAILQFTYTVATVMSGFTE